MEINEFSGYVGMKACLERFYEEHDPTKIANVEEICANFQPLELQNNLEAKYATSPAFFAGVADDILEMAMEDVPKRGANGSIVSAVTETSTLEKGKFAKSTRGIRMRNKKSEVQEKRAAQQQRFEL
jgi:hypothetical protein